jgi:Ran GTPase-activating protein (RanGAP) involved in mRNA processing and transport
MLKAYCATLVKYLTTSKNLTRIIRSTNQFTEEAETSLKEIIAETKETFAKLSNNYFIDFILKRIKTSK